MSGGWTRRDFFRRTGAMGVVALGGPAVLSACGVGGGGGDKPEGVGAAAVTFEEAKKTKNIKVGFANEAPWAFMDEKGELTGYARSEEHTSELQSRENLVCRLLLEKKKDQM